jgi:LPS-assembly protein
VTPPRWLRAAALALALGLSAPAAPAQDGAQEGAQEGGAPAVLVADRVAVDAEGRLVAEGAVEALQGDVRMEARRVTYDPETGALDVAGPITLTDGDSVVVLASAAELSSDLRDGLLRSARMVLDRQTQIAAVEMNRVDGRYTQMSRVVASSCEVCARRPIPLWRIRASRVIHDNVERQLYFRNARFEVLSVPVFYIPELRLPDPTVERARGFLAPILVDSAELGRGLKLPYFLPLGEDKDLTLTPFVAENTTTLEWRYRQAFRNGSLAAEGAISQDTLDPDPRGYLFAFGGFSLPREFFLSFDIEAASDGDYLDTYDYLDGGDRLDSALTLVRYRPDTAFVAEAINFESFRPGEDNETQPYVLGDVTWSRRFRPAGLGGLATLDLAMHGHERRSTDDVIGRDVGRLTVDAMWQRSETGPAGLLFTAGATLRGEVATTANDSQFPDPVARAIPTAGAALRWPWTRAGAGGRAQVIEPVVQLLWTPEAAAEQDQPIDESTQLEFDEGNLLALSRFPASDVTEAGLRANLGLTYSLIDPAGWSVDVTAGRILRAEDLGQFDGFQILDGERSDWLVSVGGTVERFDIVARALFDEDFGYDRFETRFGLGLDAVGLDLGGTYTWLAASETEGRPDAIEEWRVDGEWDINRRWSAAADIRYDLRLDRSAESRFGIEYRANCVTLDLGVRRRFTSATQEEPLIDYAVGVQLAGFGAGPDRPRNRACLR